MAVNCTLPPEGTSMLGGLMPKSVPTQKVAIFLFPNESTTCTTSLPASGPAV